MDFLRKKAGASDDENPRTEDDSPDSQRTPENSLDMSRTPLRSRSKWHTERAAHSSKPIVEKSLR